jgi:hypothetical protein
MPFEFTSIRPPRPDFIVELGILGLAVVLALAWIYLFSMRKTSRVLLLTGFAAAVMLGSAYVAHSGWLASFERFPPPMAFMLAAMVAMGIAFGLSPLGREAARSLAFGALIGLQAFRLPLELVMHRAAELGIMPPQLTYTGYNFDIVTGVGAVLIAIALLRGVKIAPALVWAWNLWGIACLLMILFIAVAGSPMVRLFGDEPQNLNTWVLYFPYVWLPVVLVTVAILSHVVITRKLLMSASR